MKINFKQLSPVEISALMDGLGEPSFRAGQVIDWIYRDGAISFDEMTNLPKQLRAKLHERGIISTIQICNTETSSDRTRKFLFELHDRETVESVLIPNAKYRSYTQCISSQAGCPLSCSFCVTGRLGFRRNLRSDEIIDQVIAVKRFLYSNEPAPAPPVTNLVFMGMGEPLLNIKEVIRALNVFIDLMGFSKRRITVSTAGIIPGMTELARSGTDVNLAISLNATTDKARSAIMPVNRKYPLKHLLQACRKYPLRPNRKLTFEYVLLGNINDSMEDAKRLIKLLRGIRAKVNLIPCNPPTGEVMHVQGIRLASPDEYRVAQFKDSLQKAGLTAIVRKSRGVDISAACGQLKAAYLDR